ncbi:MAG: phosphoserine phosphatase RsbU/P [Humisphaera sp.]|nr:phosphoserine phosphatase RsbU/P [Humisphaera sp.]
MPVVADAGPVEVNHSVTTAAHLPSLRVLITLIVVVPIVVVATALVTISILTSRTVAEQLGEELIHDATGSVAAEVRRYIGDAVRISDLYTRRIATGKLSSSELATWQPAMFDDLATNPNVASICFGNPQGDAVYLQRAHGRIEYGIADGAKDCAAVEWPVDAAGQVQTDTVLRAYKYDPRVRPWYKTALRNTTPAWTDVYFWFGEAGSESETGTGYTRAVRDKDNVVGVLTVDVTLSAISDFLRRQPFSATGSVFIIDDKGFLVAASDGRVNSAAGTRLMLGGSDSPAARAVATMFPAIEPAATTRGTAVVATGSAGAIESRRMNVGDQPVRVSEVSLRPYPGANWRIITVLPESAFLSQAKRMQRRSIAMASLAVAAAVVLGIVFSRRLSEPIMRLTRHAARIGGGDLDAKLHLAGARELHQLAEETNRMAAGLRQRMELEKSMALATHVQQSLLPQRVPELRGLDIAAHSRYCDATGGDYYDFIDVADRPSDHAFIAVGDVMGHGIGSALVMATARASVRTSAASGDLTLGQLMGRVNDVLSSDPHGLFMTLALLVVEPSRWRVRWASAGHDPIIAYDPARDGFVNLDGGDIPLGITAGYPFQNFSHDGIAPGWILFAGTDGVWEARDEHREMYGKDRLRDVIRANIAKTSHEIAEAVQRSLAKFVGRGPVLDDITFVVVRVIGEKEPGELTASAEKIECHREPAST